MMGTLARSLLTASEMLQRVCYAAILGSTALTLLEEPVRAAAVNEEPEPSSVPGWRH